MKADASPLERFEGWYARAIDKLAELPEGDGAFACLMIALPLYERYTVAKLKLAGSPTGLEEVKNEMTHDLGIDRSQLSRFWSAYRDGFAHQGMGQDGKTKYVVSDLYGELPTFQLVNGRDSICLNPWKFAQRVLDKYRADPRLITASESFPLATVFVI